MAQNNVQMLKDQRDALVSIMMIQQAAWTAAGMPPDFSVDGESYQWSAWYKDRIDELDKLQGLIQKLSSPFIVRSKGMAS